MDYNVKKKEIFPLTSLVRECKPKKGIAGQARNDAVHFTPNRIQTRGTGGTSGTNVRLRNLPNPSGGGAKKC